MLTVTTTNNETIKKHETKRDKFTRLMPKRVRKTVLQIELIENLFENKGAYDYTNDDVEKVTQALFTAISRLSRYKIALN